MLEKLVTPESLNDQGEKNTPHKQVLSEKQKTPTWTIVLIVVLSGILLSLIIWIITHKVDSIDLGMTITPENWFSYLVTLISILITLFVGFQIFNSIEVRRELKDAEGKYEELKNDTEQFKADFRGFQSKLEKEVGAFKLEILNKYNDTERELMKELNENTQKVDWYLKDLKKEHWDRLNDLNESIGKSKKTQEDIKKEMNDILDKWGTIKEKQDESRLGISKAFLVLAYEHKNNEIGLNLLLSSIEIHPGFENRESGLSQLLDYMTKILNKIDTFNDDMMRDKAKCLRDIRLDNFKDKADIEKKIDKILYLIDEKTHLSKDKEKQKDS